MVMKMSATYERDSEGNSDTYFVAETEIKIKTVRVRMIKQNTEAVTMTERDKV